MHLESITQNILRQTNTSLALAGFRHFDADFMNIDGRILL
ncbi:Uncharacterised protein [Providencia stuartii]|nr:Uncharacterised protein [Providencia stuartii]